MQENLTYLFYAAPWPIRLLVWTAAVSIIWLMMSAPARIIFNVLIDLDESLTKSIGRWKTSLSAWNSDQRVLLNQRMQACVAPLLAMRIPDSNNGPNSATARPTQLLVSESRALLRSLEARPDSDSNLALVPLMTSIQERMTREHQATDGAIAKRVSQHVVNQSSLARALVFSVFAILLIFVNGLMLGQILAELGVPTTLSGIPFSPALAIGIVFSAAEAAVVVFSFKFEVPVEDDDVQPISIVSVLGLVVVTCLATVEGFFYSQTITTESKVALMGNLVLNGRQMMFVYGVVIVVVMSMATRASTVAWWSRALGSAYSRLRDDLNRMTQAAEAVFAQSASLESRVAKFSASKLQLAHDLGISDEDSRSSLAAALARVEIEIAGTTNGNRTEITSANIADLYSAVGVKLGLLIASIIVAVTLLTSMGYALPGLARWAGAVTTVLSALAVGFTLEHKVMYFRELDFGLQPKLGRNFRRLAWVAAVMILVANAAVVFLSTEDVVATISSIVALGAILALSRDLGPSLELIPVVVTDWLHHGTTALGWSAILFVLVVGRAISAARWAFRLLSEPSTLLWPRRGATL